MRSHHGFSRQVLFLALLFLLAGTANPQSPAAPQSKQERQLVERVEGIYKLFVSGDWRKIEPFVSEDTRDIWFAQPKGAIESFEIKGVTVAPDGKRADVTVMVTFFVPQANATYTMPQKSEWVYEKGKWFLTVTPPPSLLEMFQAMGAPPQPEQAVSPVVFDQNPILLPKAAVGSEVVVKVSFQNVTPHVVTVQELGTTCACLKAEMNTMELRPTEKGVLTLTYQATATPPTPRLAVQALLVPSMYLLDLPVVFPNE